jgi:uracil-DNA glycosylase family 4
MAVNRTPGTDAAQANAREVLDQIRAYLEYQQSTGLDAVPRRPRPPATVPRGEPAHEPSASRSPASPLTTRAPTPTPTPAPASRPAAADLFATPGLRRAQTLEELRAELGDCQRCKLSKGRTHIVYGVGNPKATLMFVGEGPGRDEDLQAEPFVGRAGQLLTEIITKGMKLRRADVYIANVIKCRPPENRNPEPDEIAACEPFLLRQIEIIQPKVLVALGTFAAQTLLGLKTPISRLRGHWYDYHGIKLMPTLHPAYLLRNPNDKRLVWEDIKMVLRELENSA